MGKPWTERKKAEVVNYIYRHIFGADSDEITCEQKWEAFCEGDGFGPLSPEELMEINSGFDWSHVRDSSEEALERVHKKISQFVWLNWYAKAKPVTVTA